MRTGSGVFVAILALVGLAGTASAVDGVREINQTCAVNDGCFSGDTGGWPVTINSPGSYRLTSDLYTVSTRVTAVEIKVRGVTLDLNGFEITCNPPGVFCLISGSAGYGVDASEQDDVTVRNGRISGRGTYGIFARDRARIEDLIVLSAGGQSASGIAVGSECLVTGNTVKNSGGAGISTGAYCTITNNRVQGNGDRGISASSNSTAKDNIAADNQGYGIAMAASATIVNNTVFNNVAGGILAQGGATLIGNTAHDNVGPGFTLNSLAGYGNNVLTSNNGNAFGSDANPEVTGGIQIGTNVCGSDTVCP
jgi:parallel beta-helix repeat protein